MSLPHELNVCGYERISPSQSHFVEAQIALETLFDIHPIDNFCRIETYSLERLSPLYSLNLTHLSFYSAIPVTATVSATTSSGKIATRTVYFEPTSSLGFTKSLTNSVPTFAEPLPNTVVLTEVMPAYTSS